MTKKFNGDIFGRSIPFRCKIFTPTINTAKKIISNANERRNAGRFFTWPTVKRAVNIIAGISDSE